MSAVVHATAAERIAHYAQLWREAEKAAIGNRRDKQLQWAEHQAHRKLREAVDVATRGICTPKCRNVPAAGQSAAAPAPNVDHG